MGIELFRVSEGIEIDETVSILHGSGPPGLTTKTNNAGVGSTYSDDTNGDFYSKILSGSGTNKWFLNSAAAPPQLYSENAATPSVPSATGTNSIALLQESHAAADDSLAIGKQSLTRHPGAINIASGRFGSSGDCQKGQYFLRIVTANNLFNEAFMDGVGGSQRLTLPDDSTWTFRATVTAHRTDAADGHAGWEVHGVVYRQTGAANTFLQGNITKNVIARSNGQWDINITADTTNGSLKFEVKGQAGKNIRWAISVETLEVTN